jgi:hypothetical protein
VHGRAGVYRSAPCHYDRCWVSQQEAVTFEGDLYTGGSDVRPAPARFLCSGSPGAFVRRSLLLCGAFTVRCGRSGGVPHLPKRRSIQVVALMLTTRGSRTHHWLGGQQTRWAVTQGVRLVGLLMLLVIVSGMPSARATTSAVRYVATGGSDSNSGSIDQPLRTVQRAVSLSRPGDIVYVRAGTYNERVVLSGAGTVDNPVLVSGYGSERPVVTKGFYLAGSYGTVRQFEITPGYQSVDGDAPRPIALQVMGSHNTAQDIRIHGLVQTVAQEGAWVEGYGVIGDCDFTDYVDRSKSDWGAFGVTVSDHGTLRDSHVEADSTVRSVVVEGIGGQVIGCNLVGPNEDMLMAVHGKNCLIKNTSFYKVGRRVGNDTHTEMIGLDALADQSDHLTGVTFDGCIFANPPSGTDWGDGYQWEGAPFYFFFFGTGNYYSDFRFTNNVFLGGVDRIADQNEGVGHLSAIRWYNNVFNGLAGPALDDSCAWRNNIFGDGFEVRDVDGGRHQDSDYNVYWSEYHSAVADDEGSHGIVGNPGFASPVISSATRFGLDSDWRVNSILMRRGVTDAYSPTVDRDGVARTIPITVGAYEYGDSSHISTRLSIAASSLHPKYRVLRVGGRLESVTGTPLPYRMVDLQSSADGSNWKTLAAVLTDGASGTFGCDVRPETATFYRVLFRGDQSSLSSYSTTLRVVPAVQIGRPSRSRYTLARRKAYVFSGGLLPRHWSRRAVKVLTYRYVKRRWAFVKSFYGTTRGTAVYRASVRFAKSGRWRIRAYHATDTANYQAYSDYRYVRVR